MPSFPPAPGGSAPARIGKRMSDPRPPKFRLWALALVALAACAGGRGPHRPAATEPAPAPAASWLAAGPMLGHVGAREARIWLRTAAAGGILIEARAGARGLPRPTIADLGAGCLRVHVRGFRPGERVEVAIRPGRAAGEPVRIGFRAAPEPSGRGVVRLAFGSCAVTSRFGDPPVLRAIAEAAPDFMIFLGDNCYFVRGGNGPDRWKTTGLDGDWSSEERMFARQMVLKRTPAFVRLGRTLPCYAIWDDHDYGPNNADATFPHKEEALRVFERVWANPGYGIAGVPGVFSSFRRGPVEVFLMDDRYYKRTQRLAQGEEAVIWGAAQFRWLCERLEASTAPVKLIANGTQIVSLERKGEGHWREARGELDRLIDFLVQHKIGGVVFLTGDRHFSELMTLKRPDGATIVEMTSSPLRWRQAPGPLVDHPNPARLWGARGDAFGLLTVEVEGPAKGRLIFELRNETGRPIAVGGRPCRTEIPLADLLPRSDS